MPIQCSIQNFLCLQTLCDQLQLSRHDCTIQADHKTTSLWVLVFCVLRRVSYVVAVADADVELNLLCHSSK